MKAVAESNMPRNFDFAEAEPRLYDWWVKNGWFKPEAPPTMPNPSSSACRRPMSPAACISAMPSSPRWKT